MAILKTWAIKNTSDRQSKVSPKSMDGHGGTNIRNLLRNKNGYEEQMKNFQ